MITCKEKFCPIYRNVKQIVHIKKIHPKETNLFRYLVRMNLVKKQYMLSAVCREIMTLNR